MQSVQLQLTGTSPLMLVADTLADPLNPATILHKKLTSIRGKAKTEEVIYRIAHSQYTNGVYYDEDIGVHIPAQNIKASIVDGAKFNRMGAPFMRSTIMMERKIKLDYEGPKTPEGLWKKGKEFLDVRSVVVSTSKIMAYRCIIPDWSLTFILGYDEGTLDLDQIETALKRAGNQIGLGGYRIAKGGGFGGFDYKILPQTVARRRS